MIKQLMIVAVLMAFLMPQQALAKGGLIEFFFPMLKAEGPDPAKTLEAPFADKEAIKNDKQPALADNVPLNLPHRSDKQIASWLTGTVADTLTFDKIDPQDDYNEIRKFFDDKGWQQFNDYLVESKVQAVLDSRRYSLRSFVEEPPLLINKGEVSGVYKWLYEVPVMVTYLAAGQTKYDGAKQEPVTQTIIVKLQIARTGNPDDGDGLVIESWSGRLLKSSKSEL